MTLSAILLQRCRGLSEGVTAESCPFSAVGFYPNNLRIVPRCSLPFEKVSLTAYRNFYRVDCDGSDGFYSPLILPSQLTQLSRFYSVIFFNFIRLPSCERLFSYLILYLLKSKLAFMFSFLVIAFGFKSVFKNTVNSVGEPSQTGLH